MLTTEIRLSLFYRVDLIKVILMIIGVLIMACSFKKDLEEAFKLIDLVCESMEKYIIDNLKVFQTNENAIDSFLRDVGQKKYNTLMEEVEKSDIKKKDKFSKKAGNYFNKKMIVIKNNFNDNVYSKAKITNILDNWD